MNDHRSGESSTPNEPSVKGTALMSVAEDFHRLVEAGVITAEDQAKHLTPDDLDVVGSVVTAVAWYPMQTYSRLMELLFRKEAHGDREQYFIARGYRAAERLIGGTYRGFDAEAGTWGPRVGEMLMGLSRIIYNFTSWSFREVEPGVYEIEAQDAADFPDAARFTSQGFLNFFASRASGHTIEATSRRPDSHRMIYRFHDRE